MTTTGTISPTSDREGHSRAQRPSAHLGYGLAAGPTLPSPTAQVQGIGYAGNCSAWGKFASRHYFLSILMTKFMTRRVRMSYAIEERGGCDICAHHGPRSMFMIVPEDEAIARAKVEFALGDYPIPDSAPYWQRFHDTSIPVPEGMAMTCLPGQHLAWEWVNGCPKWELDTEWAGIHWRLYAKGRENNGYRVDHAHDLRLNCSSCVHRREINDVILNPGRYEVGCNAGMDTNPHRQAFEAQLARPRYNIYDPPHDAEGQIIPPAKR